MSKSLKNYSNKEIFEELSKRMNNGDNLINNYKPKSTFNDMSLILKKIIKMPFRASLLVYEYIYLIFMLGICLCLFLDVQMGVIVLISLICVIYICPKVTLTFGGATVVSTNFSGIFCLGAILSVLVSGRLAIKNPLIKPYFDQLTNILTNESVNEVTIQIWEKTYKFAFKTAPEFFEEFTKILWELFSMTINLVIFIVNFILDKIPIIGSIKRGLTDSNKVLDVVDKIWNFLNAENIQETVKEAANTVIERAEDIWNGLPDWETMKTIGIGFKETFKQFGINFKEFGNIAGPPPQGQLTGGKRKKYKGGNNTIDVSILDNQDFKFFIIKLTKLPFNQKLTTRQKGEIYKLYNLGFLQSLIAVVIPKSKQIAYMKLLNKYYNSIYYFEKYLEKLNKPMKIKPLIKSRKLISVKGGKSKQSKSKKIRKHSGINQQTGKLKKGYKYSGKKLKNGLPQIVKIKN